ncbi:cobalamin-binding protein [Motiliproteus sp. SC1-56]|uniref:cobalamin-binding protein n=1 Tax=Motiliproteus sp. SC1-56 TaxID=2799565 RepID=UPI001A8ECF96|nr:cobalamin-binding protein [Motiliproteus sp. SC1-56]
MAPPYLLAFFLLLGSAFTHAEPVSTIDDLGRTITLPAPAQRIVSLAPNITELLFSAGAGERLVGTVSYSNYPPAAQDIPRVGGPSQVDLEALLATRPDLVVAWKTGNPARALAQIERLGLPLYLAEPATLEQIASNVERLGSLAGTAPTAAREAARFRARLRTLTRPPGSRAPVRVFYQIWHEPLMTINGDHLISHLIERCGGINVFAGLEQISPTLTLEAVLTANPELIIASGGAKERPEWLDNWRRWPHLSAVANDALHVVPADLLERQSLRVVEGAERLCRHIDAVRPDVR